VTEAFADGHVEMMSYTEVFADTDTCISIYPDFSYKVSGQVVGEFQGF
jgi:hypothetical protein